MRVGVDQQRNARCAGEFEKFARGIKLAAIFAQAGGIDLERRARFGERRDRRLIEAAQIARRTEAEFLRQIGMRHEIEEPAADRALVSAPVARPDLRPRRRRDGG